MKHDSFKPHHIPSFSLLLIKSLKTPILIFFMTAGNVIMFSSAYVFLHFEKNVNPEVQNYGDALWWALCTISTVGYGDIVPVTGIGRLTGAFLIIVGIIFFLGFSASIVSIILSSLSSEKTAS
ncbi:MAG: potassium channel family protein [Bdellovibrionales bacterium]|nr:potassium channel family protein [Bdellovibrionales bacterium]